MTELILSSVCPSKLNLDSSRKELHSSLKNLDFEKSGHKGFQKELSTEQLQNINAIPDKEDKENKVTAITEESTHEQYPSAKAVYDAMDAHGDFELIQAYTMSEDVQQFTTKENGNKYKEMLLRIKIPTMNPDKSTSFTKGRVGLQDQNYNALFSEHYDMYQDLGYTWFLTLSIKVCGTTCIVERMMSPYASYLHYGSSSNGYSSSEPAGNVLTNGVDLPDGYLTKLIVTMYPAGGRLFPNGTYFELWGVRA